MVKQTLQPVQTLQSVNEQGILRGFPNLFRQENKKWWGTRRWLIQVVVWTLITNGILALVILAEENTAEGLVEMFFTLTQIFLAVGVAISSQGIIVGEKQSGTAEWLLSKPVSRTAFILSRTIAAWIASMVVMITIPALVAYFQISNATGNSIDLPSFLTGLSMVALHTTFYLTLTVMLGAFFNSRGPVIGIPLIVLFAPQIAGELILKNNALVLFEILPSGLLQMVPIVASGQSIPSITPLIATAVWSILFIVAASWRFERQEF